MAGTFSRLSKAAWIQNLGNRVRVLFSSKYLLFTNTTITICLSGTGDLLQQNYEMFQKRQSAWDRTRTRNICVSGTVIGPTCHFWYRYLDRILPGKTLKVVGRKVLLDQFIFSPINISLFLVVMGLLESASMKSVFKDLRDKGLTLLKAEWIIWPPAQILNFAFISPRYRVLYDNSVSLGFDYYYSYVKFHNNDEDDEDDDDDKAAGTVGTMSSGSVDWSVFGPSHHLGATCYELMAQRKIMKQLRNSSKCHSEFDY